MSLVNNDDKEMPDKDISINFKSVGQELQTLIETTSSTVDMSIFGESKGYADVTLVVEERKIPVTKAVLGIVSPVFQTMFQSDFREKETSEIPLPDKNFNSFMRFLRCIYPNIMEQVSVENVYDVITLANEYQVEHLKTACEQVLLKEMIKWEEPTSTGCYIEVYRHLVIAETCQLEKLQALCVGIASEATKADREAAAKVHPISKKLEMLIDKQSIGKLEINTADLEKILREVEGDDLEAVKDYINGKPTIQPQQTLGGGFGFGSTSGFGGFQSGGFTASSVSSFGQVTPDVHTSPSCPDPTAWIEHLQKLRWVYKYDQESMKKDAIQKVRSDRLQKGWETTCGEEFELLPEKIKHDIRGREIMKY